ncbi:MAG: hypothetical protein GF401_00425, partial [Chitinivibrionales bacterium]|nr:hypothetical protein [Chitinivibrionales bacterium]
MDKRFQLKEDIMRIGQLRRAFSERGAVYGRIQVHTTLFICAGQFVAYSQDTVSIFLLGGQSNMLGQGNPGEISPPLSETQEDILFLENSNGNYAWGPMTPYFGKEDECFGPELKFSRIIADTRPDRTVAIVKHTEKPLTLAEGWNVETNGSTYLGMIAKVRGGMELLDAIGRPYVVAGMLWFQGEYDAVEQWMAQAYEQNLNNLIAGVRNEFSVPGMPFVIGQIYDIPLDQFPYTQEVQDAQDAVAESDPLTGILHTTDLPIGNDNIHFKTEGQLAIGQRFATVYLSLIGENTVAVDTDRA